MSAAWRRFPDVQLLLLDTLEPFVGAGRAAINTPHNLADVMPFIRVRKGGGASDRLTDLARVDVDVFTATYAASEELAERIRQHLVGPPPPVMLLDRVEVVVSPQELEWGDPQIIRRFGATYRLATRRVLAE